MQDYAAADHESIDERTRRAATEAMVVVNEAACLFTVYSGETGEYRVDLRLGTCECADARYRDRECKHQKRVRMAIGEDEIPEGVDVDPVLRNRREDAGDATDTDTSERSVATDGGQTIDTPAYTEHTEPATQGGKQYVRCEGCERELLVELGGRDSLPHADDCPNAADANAFCQGCGTQMWEYSEEAKADGWCISCAPECYGECGEYR